MTYVYNKYEKINQMRKPTIWFPTRSDTNQPVQSQKQSRSLKFFIQVEEGLYYPSSEKKELISISCAVLLRLCFHICK